MPKQLTTQNATITTAAVEVKTLTISGKQVTLAVFRQLRREKLIADDGTLNGVPWGYVNYHPDKCADERAHRHLVWQQGEDLLRASVDMQPDFDRINPYDGEPVAGKFFNEAANRLLTGRVHEWLTGQAERSPLRLKARPTASTFYSDTATLGSKIGFPVVGVASEAAVRAADRHCAWSRAQKEAEGYPSTSYFHKVASDARPALDQAIAELADEIAAWGVDLDDVLAELNRSARAEAARRQRHRDVRKALAELPQLFIAV